MALFLARKLLDDRPFTSSDDEPEDVDWINDSTRPLIHASELGCGSRRNALIASLPPDLVARAWPADPSSPLNPLRASHRGEHLHEIEVALR